MLCVARLNSARIPKGQSRNFAKTRRSPPFTSTSKLIATLSNIDTYSVCPEQSMSDWNAIEDSAVLWHGSLGAPNTIKPNPCAGRTRLMSP